MLLQSTAAAKYFHRPMSLKHTKSIYWKCLRKISDLMNVVCISRLKSSSSPSSSSSSPSSSVSFIVGDLIQISKLLDNRREIHTHSYLAFVYLAHFSELLQVMYSTPRIAGASTRNRRRPQKGPPLEWRRMPCVLCRISQSKLNYSTLGWSPKINWWARSTVVTVLVTGRILPFLSPDEQHQSTEGKETYVHTFKVKHRKTQLLYSYRWAEMSCNTAFVVLQDMSISFCISFGRLHIF